MLKSIKIWWLITLNAFQQTLTKRANVVIFLIGKSLRIGLFAIFLTFLFRDAIDIAGYNREQIIFFYLTFNLVDTLSQLLFREVYRFKDLVVTGRLDMILLKPINPLIRVLLGGADVVDLIIFSVLLGVTIWYGTSFITWDLLRWIFYLLMIINGLIIAGAFHIFVLGVGVITISIDHLIMVYRDLGSMLRIPVDLYIQPIRFLLTFIIPLGIMFTFPAKMLMGLVSLQFILIAIAISILIFTLSLKFWGYSLKQYSSASS